MLSPHHDKPLITTVPFTGAGCLLSVDSEELPGEPCRGDPMRTLRCSASMVNEYTGGEPMSPEYAVVSLSATNIT